MPAEVLLRLPQYELGRYLKTSGMDRADFRDHRVEVLGERYDEFLARQL